MEEFFRTMERQLTEREWSQVRRRHGDMDRLQAFYRYWVSAGDSHRPPTLPFTTDRQTDIDTHTHTYTHRTHTEKNRRTDTHTHTHTHTQTHTHIDTQTHTLS